MNTVEILGYAAGPITTLTFLPQVIKTWKMKSAHDVSLLMFIIAAVNEVMWIAYGAFLEPMNGVIIKTNTIVLAMSLTMILLKIGYSGKKEIRFNNL